MTPARAKRWLRSTFSQLLLALMPKIQKAKTDFHDIAVGNDDSLEEFRKPIPEDGNQIFIGTSADADLKKALFDLLKERTKIYEEQAERSEISAETYLWLANAGFSAAIVTLEAKAGGVLGAWSVKLSLSCFLISIAVIGYIKAQRIVRNYRLREFFRKYYIRFIISEISLQQLINLDRNVSREPKALIYPAWASYILFFVGAALSVIGIIIK